MSSEKGTFGITGVPPPKDVVYKTDPENHLPYVTGMPLRYELTEYFEQMMKTGDSGLQKQWTLFVKGLERFKSLPIEDKLSFFQIAGIHGYPMQSWDGAKMPRATPTNPKPGENPNGGYCNHNTIAFPTWHRPYMLLYEQCIWLNMRAVVEEWVKDKTLTQADAASWLSAADTWRLFYWDWAKKQKYPSNATVNVEAWNDFGMPYLFSLPNVPVFLPTGRDNSYPNPMWNFENPEKDPVTKKPLPFGKMPAGKEKWNIPDDPEQPDPDSDDTTLPWSMCTSTSRYGILYNKETKQYSGLEGSNEWANANMALATAGDRLYKPRRGDEQMTDEEWRKERPGNLADALNRMFSPDYNGTWSAFASTKWYAEKETDLRTGYMSLEYIHNNIHNLTGGSTVDQPEKSDANTQPVPEVKPLYGLGHMCDVPVAAFDPIFWMHHCNIDRLTAMWQCLNWDKWFEKEPPAPPGSEHVEDMTPEAALEPFHLHDGGDPNDEKNKWTSILARDWTKLGYQYDTLVPEKGAIDSDGKLIAENYKLDLQIYIHTTYPGTSYQAWAIRQDETINNAAFFGPNTAKQETFEDYIINVVYDRYALNGKSYTIYFSIGGKHVGQVYSLGGMRPGKEVGCANCGNQKNARILSKAQVPIAIPLMRKAANKEFSALGTFQAEDVEKYLAEEGNFSWEFVAAGGQVLSPDQFPNTKISVLAGKARWSRQEKDGQEVFTPPLYATHTYRPLYEATKEKPLGAQEGDRLAAFYREMSLDEVDIEAAPAA